MKVSKKEYRDKQNQATGALLISVLALIMIVFHCYHVLVNGELFEWERWIGWLILFPAMFVIWRRRERELSELEVDHADQ